MRRNVAFDDEVQERNDPAWAGIEPIESQRHRVKQHAMEMDVNLRDITDNALAGWTRYVGGALSRAQMASRVARGERHQLGEDVLVCLGRAWAVLKGVRVVAVWPRGRGRRALASSVPSVNPPRSLPGVGDQATGGR
jgi:hypothetical protein